MIDLNVLQELDKGDRVVFRDNRVVVQKAGLWTRIMRSLPPWPSRESAMAGIESFLERVCNLVRDYEAALEKRKTRAADTLSASIDDTFSVCDISETLADLAEALDGTVSRKERGLCALRVTYVDHPNSVGCLKEYVRRVRQIVKRIRSIGMCGAVGSTLGALGTNAAATGAAAAVAELTDGCGSNGAARACRTSRWDVVEDEDEDA